MLTSPASDLGGRVRALRLWKRLSQRELSRRCGLAHTAISQIEQNRVSPSVASLRKLVGALGVSLADFFVGDDGMDGPVFYAAGALREIGSGPVSLRLVGSMAPGRRLQLLHETYAPGADTGAEMLAHEGEEGGVVVAGHITVTVGEETRVLGPGDAYLFASTIPHRFRNEGDESAVLVSAATPPTF